LNTPNRLTVASALLALGGLVACDAMPTSSDPAVQGGFLSRDGGESVARTYEVTIDNLTGGQPLTPPLVVTHQRAADLFDVGSPAPFEIKEIAENGNLGPMLMALDENDHVSSVVVADAGTPPPVLPEGGVTFQIEAEPGARFLSFVAMLICTNDGFTGVDGLALPSQVGGSVTRHLSAYDAGTEMNTEDFANLVPPCPALTGVSSSVPGSGMSEPALAEGGVIRMHPGIQGVADLQTGLHGWTDPVARVTVTRVN